MAKKVEYKGINEELQLSTVECLDAGTLGNDGSDYEDGE